jgi:hypothetical protein
MNSQFLESELELYVQRLLVHESYTTGNQYRMLKISPSEERLQGYDAEIIGLTPFYCQFKTSDHLSQNKLYNTRQSFFHAKGWPCSPFYSFALREPNHAADKRKPQVWQHNVLHQLWKANSSGVAYVAPAFHTRLELELMEPIVGSRYCPWINGRDPHSSISIKNVAVNGHERCRLPFFEGLVSVPPHIPVTDLKHHYCFTSHRDITFHSKPELVGGGMPFGSALSSFVSLSAENEETWTKKMTVDAVRSSLGDIGGNDAFLLPFLGFGLLQAGLTEQEFSRDAAGTFEREATLLQQHVALAASLRAYFGITTLGLLKFRDK